MSGISASGPLAYAPVDDHRDGGFLGLSSQGWAKIGVVAALFVAIFWPNLRRLWLKTAPYIGEPNWGHAIVVPLVGLYYLYVHREELARARGQQFLWGSFLRPGRLWVGTIMAVVGVAAVVLSHSRDGMLMSIMSAIGWTCATLGVLALILDWSIACTLFGLAVYVYGIAPGQNDYLKDVGMIITLFGITLLIYGWEVMKVAWFPIVFLICAIPWPGLVYSWIAEPLQQMAATVAVWVLKLTGVESLTSGTKIVILNADFTKPPRVLNVAEACAGMRSLMTFITVGGAIAFYSNRPLWQKAIIVFSSVPIAIFCNVMRISGQGLLDHYVSPEWSESFAHQFIGLVMLLPAFFLIVGVAVLLDKLFIEEADEVEQPATIIRKAPKSSYTSLVTREITVTRPDNRAVAGAVLPVAPIARTAPVSAGPAAVSPVALAAEAKAASVISTSPATAPTTSPAALKPTKPTATPTKPAAPAVRPAAGAAPSGVTSPHAVPATTTPPRPVVGATTPPRPRTNVMPRPGLPPRPGPAARPPAYPVSSASRDAGKPVTPEAAVAPVAPVTAVETHTTDKDQA